ncbi:MAG: hypothetical protein CVV41_00145 [Candidatus Riflebacteria bacterium HGW-Riflebacteria-1]|jgi:UDP-2,3-diacylglucosamine pyrophosphatase LpxH|nr:MAG: hypothetical protein CVV41_00145 [Candidatus Riflebacteria bacterium HGW-Riflebacteria-1]
MQRRTVFVSDLHIGTGVDTNWYQKSVHEPLLKNFLRYVQSGENHIDELVILGDWFDLWNYPPFSSPPDLALIMRQNPAIFTRHADGDFVSLLDTVDVRYVNGDHDMEVELREVNRLLANLTDRKILPGHGSDNEKTALANTYYMQGAIWAEHGNQHDLFNKPSQNDANPLAPLPLGYFVTRIYCHYLQKRIASVHRSDAAAVAGCCETNLESFGIKLETLVQKLLNQLKKGEKLNPASIILEMMMQHNRNNLLEFKLGNASLAEVNTDGIARFYPDLINEDNFYDALCEAEVAFDGLTHFAREHVIRNPHTRVVVMGHTHSAHNMYCGSLKNHVFANPGYFCPPQPDIDTGLHLPGFIEVESFADGSMKVCQKVVSGTLSEDIREISALRVY